MSENKKAAPGAGTPETAKTEIRSDNLSPIGFYHTSCERSTGIPGKKRNPVAWQYFAPYEPTDAQKPEPEKEEPPFDLDDALRELDRLHDAVPKLNPRTELSAFSAHLSGLVERRMHMGPTEYGRRCGISASRAASYVDGYHCPRGEVYEALKKGIREKWEEMQHERV